MITECRRKPGPSVSLYASPTFESAYNRIQHKIAHGAAAIAVRRWVQASNGAAAVTAAKVVVLPVSAGMSYWAAGLLPTRSSCPTCCVHWPKDVEPENRNARKEKYRRQGRKRDSEGRAKWDSKCIRKRERETRKRAGSRIICCSQKTMPRLVAPYNRIRYTTSWAYIIPQKSWEVAADELWVCEDLSFNLL